MAPATAEKRKYEAEKREEVTVAQKGVSVPILPLLPEKGERPDSEHFAKALPIVNRACYDLAHMHGERISEFKLDKILRKAAKRVALEKEYESLKPYIVYVAERGHLFKFNPADRSYTIR